MIIDYDIIKKIFKKTNDKKILWFKSNGCYIAEKSNVKLAICYMNKNFILSFYKNSENIHNINSNNESLLIELKALYELIEIEQSMNKEKEINEMIDLFR
jgi:hypothetical protein